MESNHAVRPETARRFRLAAAFLLHYHDAELAAEGVEEILGELGAGENGDRETAGFMFAVAELAWRMAGELGPEEAEAFLREVAANAALSEVTGHGC